ncbi:MAG TPA: fused MFS/spermidine synthase, partial [Gemmatimonadaceae bacterium]
MSDAVLPSPSTVPAARRYLPLLLGLFVVSGVCALIYEVVWFQLLQNVIGSTAVSLGVLLATFMGGMCLGSLALPRLVPVRRHPLRVYAMIELGIGVIGILTLLFVPSLGRLYTALVGPTLGGVLMRGLVCAVCLLPPTMLMGATLPAIARWIQATPRGVSWMGLLYGANTVGAVFGGVLAGFYLLRAYDITTATLVAATLNGMIAAVAWLVARRAGAGPALRAPDCGADVPFADAWVVYVAIGLSGASALGAEVVWTRLLSLLFGGTVYTFAMILAVFLTGLGAGSAAGSWLARRTQRPRLTLGWCQLLQTVGVAWAALMIANVLPFWPVNPALSPSPWFSMHLDLTRAMWVVLPAAMLWGASFPLAVASVARPDCDSGRLVGRVYAANTVGAIVGSLAFSLVLIPRLGTRVSHQVLIVTAALSALLLFVRLASSSGRTSSPATRPTPRLWASLSAATAAVAAIVIAARVSEIPGVLIAYGRYAVSWLDQVDILYTGEGVNASIAVSRVAGTGARQFHVAGKVEGSSLPQDMRLQRMLGHLPALLHPNPQSALVVGFGAGVTAGSVIVHPGLQRLVICENEPLIPRVIGKWFREENHDVLHDPRVQMVYDDARNYVLTTSEQFDLITSDPIHPWVKGAAAFYTREYFETLRAHLKPGGIVSQWVPLYESNLDAVKSEIATFFEVFPHGTVWANTMNAQGYDLVLIGTLDSTRIDLDTLEARLARPEFTPVAQSLRQVGFYGLLDLLATYSGNAGGLAPWL